MPDDVGLADDQVFDVKQLLTFGEVTDSYLLGLTRAHDGQVATFERRWVVNSVRRGAHHLCLIT